MNIEISTPPPIQYSAVIPETPHYNLNMTLKSPGRRLTPTLQTPPKQSPRRSKRKRERESVNNNSQGSSPTKKSNRSQNTHLRKILNQINELEKKIIEKEKEKEKEIDDEYNIFVNIIYDQIKHFRNKFHEESIELFENQTQLIAELNNLKKIQKTKKNTNTNNIIKTQKEIKDLQIVINKSIATIDAISEKNSQLLEDIRQHHRSEFEKKEKKIELKYKPQIEKITIELDNLTRTLDIKPNRLNLEKNSKLPHSKLPHPIPQPNPPLIPQLQNNVNIFEEGEINWSADFKQLEGNGNLPPIS